MLEKVLGAFVSASISFKLCQDTFWMCNRVWKVKPNNLTWYEEGSDAPFSNQVPLVIQGYKVPPFSLSILHDSLKQS